MYTVYMYTCMYVMLYYGMYVCVYLCMYGCICVCMYVCMYACMYVCAYVHIILYAHDPHQDLPFYPAFLYFMDSLQCEPSAICHLLHTKENSKSKPILELRVPQKQIKHNNDFDDLPPLPQPQSSSPKPLVLYTQIPTLSSEPSPQIHSIQWGFMWYFWWLGHSIQLIAQYESPMINQLKNENFRVQRVGDL